jgi:hypothetical protein
MPADLGPRFVLEAGFLILLAVVVALADLSPALIVLVMAIGWLLVALLEYLAWRQSPAFSAPVRYEEGAGSPPAQETVQEQIVEEARPRPTPPPSPAHAPAPAPAPAAAEEETMVEPAAGTAEPEAPAAFRPEPEQHVRYSLEPLQPRPRRRWILFGPRDRSEGPVEGSSEEER